MMRLLASVLWVIWAVCTGAMLIGQFMIWKQAPAVLVGVITATQQLASWVIGTAVLGILQLLADQSNGKPK